MFERNPPPHLKRAPIKKEELNDYGFNLGRMSLGGYVIATMDILPSLQYMLDTATSFEELKKELTALIQDRQEFLDYERNTPAPDFPR